MSTVEELRDVRDQIDRACRVVMASAASYETTCELTPGMSKEWKATEVELVALRCRERELMAGAADVPHTLSADLRSHGEGWAECALRLSSELERARTECNQTRDEGVAQGRRELAKEALTERSCHGFEAGWELLCVEAAK